MNPDEKLLLDRTAKLSEENNVILRKLLRAQRWSAVWGFIKLVLIIVPLIIGYVFLKPYLGSIGNTYKNAEDLLNLYQTY